MNKPYRPKYYWNEFNNTSKKSRRLELNAHNDPDNPFKLDIGGEG